MKSKPQINWHLAHARRRSLTRSLGRLNQMNFYRAIHQCMTLISDRENWVKRTQGFKALLQEGEGNSRKAPTQQKSQELTDIKKIHRADGSRQSKRSNKTDMSGWQRQGAPDERPGVWAKDSVRCFDREASCSGRAAAWYCLRTNRKVGASRHLWGNYSVIYHGGSTAHWRKRRSVRTGCLCMEENVQFVLKLSTGLCAAITMTARRIAGAFADPGTLAPLTACRLIALDKSPGVRPVGVGEVVLRIISKSNLSVISPQKFEQWLVHLRCV